jgi:hypothetical protein
MEIILANGRRIVVGADVDGDVLARVAAALERGESRFRRDRGCGWRAA